MVAVAKKLAPEQVPTLFIVGCPHVVGKDPARHLGGIGIAGTNRTFTGGVFTADDPQAANYPQRFHRIVKP